jgi:hypothetical protein
MVILIPDSCRWRLSTLGLSGPWRTSGAAVHREPLNLESRHSLCVSDIPALKAAVQRCRDAQSRTRFHHKDEFGW